LEYTQLKWKKKRKKLEDCNEPGEGAVKGEERVMVKEERKWVWDCGEGER
jgi:hypothetical protein